MGFEKGQKYIFKIKGSRRNGNGLYYAIDVNGTEQYVKAYEFQKRQALAEIRCICKGINEYGRPVFMQDIAGLIAQLYKVGDEGDFRIKAQPGNRGYYEVTDENEFCFRLVGYGSEKFYNNQMVRCRITFINMVRVEMELANGFRNISIPFYDLEKLTSLDPRHRVSPRLLRGVFLSQPFARVRKQYYEGNPLWVISALQTVNDNLHGLVSRRGSGYKSDFLKSFIDICTSLLEDSDYLTHAAEAESSQYQRDISVMIARGQDLLKALELMKSGTGQEYLTGIMTKLKTSGYVYNPERHMRVVTNIFALTPPCSLNHIVDQIFSVIREQHHNVRFLRIFARPFAKVLDMFVDHYAAAHTLRLRKDAGSMLEIILRALAIRLLLTEGNSDADPNYKIYQSMLYRYASLFQPDAENVESLTYKAYEALFGSFSRGSDFTWSNVYDMPALCARLAASSPALATRAPEPLCFSNNGVKVLTNGHRMTLSPAVPDHELHNAVPDNIFTSTPVSIMLSCDIPVPSAPDAPLQQYQRMWNEIYRALFVPESEQSLPRHRRRLPKVGDEVTVRITGQSETSPYEYVCRIEEEDYWGAGTINPAKQIVAYNVKVSTDSFIDKATGKPYLLRATVERIDPNGNISFSMRPGIARFNCETLDADIRNLVVVSRVDPHQYLCITRGGVTMFIPRDESTPLLRLNDFLVADIVSIFDDGNVQGSIAGRAYETFDRTEAFENLISDYADGNVYDGPVTEDRGEAGKEAPQPMPDAYMRELICVIERKGMMQQSMQVMYSYLAVARILAHILGDQVSEHFYRRYMELLVAFNDFGQNGNVDDETMQELISGQRQMEEIYPELTDILSRLKIVNSLDNPDRGNYLWEECHNAPDPFTRKLASMVLAHNLVTDAESRDIRISLRADIYAMLGLDTNQ